MMKFILSSIIVLLLNISPVTASSAGMDAPTGKWWRNQRVVQRLNLSRDEISRLDAAFFESRKNLIELKGRVEIEQLELETLIESPNFSESDVLKQYQDLEKARTALGTERFKFFLSVRKIVGHEKFQQLMMMKKNRDRLKHRKK